MDCSPPSLSVHGIFQERILEWVAIPFCRTSSLPMDQSQVSCIAGGFFTIWATREMAFMFCCRHPGLETKILHYSIHYSIQYCKVHKSTPLVEDTHTWQCTPDSSVQFSHSVVSDSLQPHGCKGSSQASLSITNYRSLLKLMPIESVMPSNHLILSSPDTWTINNLCNWTCKHTLHLWKFATCRVLVGDLLYSGTVCLHILEAISRASFQAMWLLPPPPGISVTFI